MERRCGYIRVWKGGPAELDQRAVLASAGISEPQAAIYVDRASSDKRALSQRAGCLAEVLAGDAGEIVVAAIWVLAVNAADLFEIAAEVSRKGVTIRDVAAGKTHRWSPDVGDLAEAAAAVQKHSGQQRLEKARKTRARTGLVGGRKPKLSGQALRAALDDWGNPNAGTNAEVASRHNVSVATLQRAAKMTRTEAIARAGRPPNVEGSVGLHERESGR